MTRKTIFISPKFAKVMTVLDPAVNDQEVLGRPNTAGKIPFSMTNAARNNAFNAFVFDSPVIGTALRAADAGFEFDQGNILEGLVLSGRSLANLTGVPMAIGLTEALFYGLASFVYE